MMHVISTGYNAPTKARCLASVRAQMIASVRVGLPYVASHTYIEAAEQSPPKPPLQNFIEACADAAPNDIIVMLDGDDWLMPGALARVAKEYENPEVWATYGSFKFADGRPGFVRPYPPGCNYREQPWLATHLKTCRAGLIHRIESEDLAPGGVWLNLCRDMAVMWPVLEMAGEDRVRYISDVLYVYNYASSWEHNASAVERMGERPTQLALRARAPYKRLERL